MGGEVINHVINILYYRNYLLILSSDCVLVQVILFKRSGAEDLVYDAV